MSNQICFFKELEEIQTYEQALYRRKRNWENNFQRWSDKQFQDGTTTNGKCGYGTICDWCEDNSYGRPCVRALNSMCREKGITIDYNNRNFEEIW